MPRPAIGLLLDWSADLAPCIHHELDGMQRSDGTLSETLARTWRTETTPGRVAWTITLAAGCAWLWWHIVTFEYSSKGHAGARPDAR